MNVLQKTLCKIFNTRIKKKMKKTMKKNMKKNMKNMKKIKGGQCTKKK